jgi:hypothetical protein
VHCNGLLLMTSRTQHFSRGSSNDSAHIIINNPLLSSGLVILHPQGSISPTFSRPAFMLTDPISAKKTCDLTVFICAFGICTGKSCTKNVDDTDPWGSSSPTDRLRMCTGCITDLGKFAWAKGTFLMKQIPQY